MYQAAQSCKARKTWVQANQPLVLCLINSWQQVRICFFSYWRAMFYQSHFLLKEANFKLNLNTWMMQHDGEETELLLINQLFPTNPQSYVLAADKPVLHKITLWSIWNITLCLDWLLTNWVWRLQWTFSIQTAFRLLNVNYLPVIIQCLNGIQKELITHIYISSLFWDYKHKLIKQSQAEIFLLNECKAGGASSLHTH